MPYKGKVNKTESIAKIKGVGKIRTVITKPRKIPKKKIIKRRAIT